ncbi:SNF2 family N-terminal domain-containing protein [Cunninghamella echinulata]|nr:SNF2 family N-terminal domain-containing protein [Cunninghamella echinulata]
MSKPSSSSNRQGFHSPGLSPTRNSIRSDSGKTKIQVKPILKSQQSLLDSFHRARQINYNSNNDHNNPSKPLNKAGPYNFSPLKTGPESPTSFISSFKYKKDPPTLARFNQPSLLHSTSNTILKDIDNDIDMETNNNNNNNSQQKVDQNDNDDDDDDEEIIPKIKRRRMRHQHLDSDDDGDHDGNTITTKNINKLASTRRYKIKLSDDEDEDDQIMQSSSQQQQQQKEQGYNKEDDDGDDTVDDEEDDEQDIETYLDKSKKQTKQMDLLSDTQKVEFLSQKYKHIKKETIRQILVQQCNRKIMEAIKVLDTLPKNQSSLTDMDKWKTGTNSSSKNKKRRANHDSDEDSEDEQISDEARIAEELKRSRQLAKALTFYNQASTQDIMDTCGCKLIMAEKLISLRPFLNIDDLSDKLKETRGLSIKFIDAYIEMMDGYDIVDQMIENIESVGYSLQRIINVWGKLNTLSSSSQQQSSPMDLDQDGDGGGGGDDDDDDDDEAGIHLTQTANHLPNHQQLNISNALYKEAMDGFLTQQPAIVNPEFKLNSYQILGVNWMLLLYRKNISGILADEMGLGKTAQVISFLGRLYELGEKGPHLIIVPSSTIDNWLREFERFCPTLNVVCYYGSMAEREELREEIMEEVEDIQAIVTTYNIAGGRMEDKKFLKRLKCKSMILDEGHMVKNCLSARYNNLMSIRTPFRLLLTGTPLQNNLQELISLLTFILPKMFAGCEDDIRKIFKLKSYGNSSSSSSTSSSSPTPPLSSSSSEISTSAPTTPTTTDTTMDSMTTTDLNRNVAQILSRKRIQRAKKMMTPFVLRRKKAQVLSHLPKKTHYIEQCPMTTNQQQLYHTIINDSKSKYKDILEQDEDNSNMKEVIGNKTKKNSMVERFTNVIMHLRKAADHPLLFRNIYTDDKIKVMAKEIMKEEKYWDANETYIYEDMSVMTDFELMRLCRDHKSIRSFMLDNEEWMEAGKVQRLKQILPTIKQQGNKILLFSQFTSMLDILEYVMKTLGFTFLRLDGTTKVGERQILIDQFNQDESIDIFLLSTKAGGFGINLTSANVVIMYDMDFNPQNDRQAEDRSHRVGQKKDVHVYKLISENTIENQILAMADIRLKLDQSISGEEDGDNESTLDTQKVKGLLKSVLLSS